MFKFLKKLFTKKSAPTTSVQNEQVPSQEPLKVDVSIDKPEVKPAQENLILNDVVSQKDESVELEAKAAVPVKKATPTKAKVTKPAPKKKTPATKEVVNKTASDEKIKSVKLQKLPIKKNQILESKRKSKKYSVSVTPQTAGEEEYNEVNKINVFVLAGSKKEALETLSNAFSGEQPSYEGSNLNLANIGAWDKGNRVLFEIISFEKNT